jgi:hypothetical protein
MIHITFENISIKKMSNSTGIFIGQKNELGKFQSKRVINEVVGSLSGNENRVLGNKWLKDRDEWKEA